MRECKRIGGPFEKIVGNRSCDYSLPSRDWRRLFGLSNHALAYSLR